MFDHELQLDGLSRHAWLRSTPEKKNDVNHNNIIWINKGIIDIVWRLSLSEVRL